MEWPDDVKWRRALVFATDADWVRFGDSSSSLTGKSLTVGDVNGDDIPDLVIGLDEVSSSDYIGVTLVMDGATITWGLTAMTLLSWTRRWILRSTPLQAGSKINEPVESVAVLGDLTGDGVPEFISSTHLG